MNCKPGDLAFLIHPEVEENRGALVRVIGRGVSRDWRIEPLQIIKHTFSEARGVQPYKSGTCMSTDDWRLKPIRDNDGDDETLTWAGKPREGMLEHCNRLIADFNKLAEWCKEHQK